MKNLEASEQTRTTDEARRERRQKCARGEHEAIAIEGLSQYAVCKHCSRIFLKTEGERR